jgi:predicted metal-dependent HD superfamily phosphohydrolase
VTSALESRLPVPAEFWRHLRALYAAPPRRYHTFEHVEEVLRWYDQVAASPGWQQPDEVLCALLFHDAIYAPGAADNEARSAAAARAALARWLPAVDADRVAVLVELTARHGALVPGEVDRDAALFLDCDMAILGAAPEDYRRYAAQIGEEWAPALPPAAYRAGRRAFLQRLLASPAIYLTDMFRGRLEEAARANIAAEVTALAAL